MSGKIAENFFVKIKNQIQSLVRSHGMMGNPKRSRSRSVKKCTHSFKSGRVTRNPFLNFLRDFRRSNCGLKLTELTKKGAEIWKQMNDRQKSPYCHLARQAPKRRVRRRIRSKRGRRRRRRSVSRHQDKNNRDHRHDQDKCDDAEMPPQQCPDQNEAPNNLII